MAARRGDPTDLIDIETDDVAKGDWRQKPPTGPFAASDYPELQWLEKGFAGSQSYMAANTIDMDPQSRALIESLIMEDAHYLGHPSNTANAFSSSSSSTATGHRTTTTSSASKKPQKIQKPANGRSGASSTAKKSTSTSTGPSSARPRWTPAETAALTNAVEIYGYGAWNEISKHVGTRTVKQTAAHARHLLLQGVRMRGAPKELMPRLMDTSIDTQPQTPGKAKVSITFKPSPERGPSQPEPSLKSEPHLTSPSLHVIHKNNNNSSNSNDNDMDVDIDIDVDIDTLDDIDDQQTVLPKTEPLFDHADVASLTVIDVDTPLLPSNELNIPKNSSVATHALKDPITIQNIETSGSLDRVDTPNASQQPNQHDNGNTNFFLQKHTESGTETMIRTPLLSHNHHAGVKLEHVKLEDAVVLSDAPTASPNKQDDDHKDRNGDADHVSEDKKPETEQTPETYTIDVDDIKPFEVEYCPEWFLGTQTAKRANKTSSRYMLIRNHILAFWDSMKPRTVTTTMVRSGLEGQGDVNAITRVHTFLENIGAINTNGVKRRRSPQSKSHKRSKKSLDSDHSGSYEGSVYGEKTGLLEWSLDTTPSRLDGVRRRRRVRAENGDWVWEVDGVTITHGDGDETLSTADQTDKMTNASKKTNGHGETHKKKRPRRQSTHAQDASAAAPIPYDPFALVPLKKYTETDSRLAIRVNVDSNTLVVMDFHAHLAHTEVIGLLGGKFNASTKDITISSVVPCESASTNTQCEMDPRSETKAREVFESQGLDVVGWYHSHPTFEPNPSVRDLETQMTYQTLFRRHDGVEPFVGVIVSPYDPKLPVLVSRFQFLSLSMQFNAGGEYRLPYTCLKSIVPSGDLPTELFFQLADLALQYKTHPDLINLRTPFRSNYAGTATKLEKLSNSLESHLLLAAPEDKAKLFLDRVMDVVITELCVNQPEQTDDPVDIDSDGGVDNDTGNVNGDAELSDHSDRAPRRYRKGDMIAVEIRSSRDSDSSSDSDEPGPPKNVAAKKEAEVSNSILLE